MKKIIAALLCLILLLPVAAGCSSGLESVQTGSETEEKKTEVTEQKTEEDKKQEEAEIPPVCDKLSWEKINSFPLASNDMTEEELRSLCVDFFRFSQTFAWTPDKDHGFQYTLSGKTTKKTVEQGTVYGGLPYMRGTGNVYRIMEFYDPETGVVNMEEAASNQLYFGNQCSIGASWGWARVINSADYQWTADCVVSNGFLPVGPYTYDPSLYRLGSDQINSTDICLDNGEQIMFQSYAALKPADGLVYYTTAGHVIMCSSLPVVVMNPDGTINGDESYLTFIDQDTGWVEGKQTDGSPFQVQGSVDRKTTFTKLFKSSYLPFTFAEFLGTDPIEPLECSIDIEGPSVNRNDLSNAKVKCNYYISDVHVYIYDENEEEVLHKASRVSSAGRTEHPLLGAAIATSAKRFCDGKHTVVVTCTNGYGTSETVYRGILEAE